MLCVCALSVLSGVECGVWSVVCCVLCVVCCVLCVVCCYCVLCAEWCVWRVECVVCCVLSAQCRVLIVRSPAMPQHCTGDMVTDPAHAFAICIQGSGLSVECGVWGVRCAVLGFRVHSSRALDAGLTQTGRVAGVGGMFR